MELIRLRREDKEDRKRGGGVSKVSKEEKSGGGGGGGEVDVMSIEYNKRGSVREWDLGKEGL